MARPVKIRKTESYIRDIENLGRLRTALLMDYSLETKVMQEATKAIDTLISRLKPLIK